MTQWLLGTLLATSVLIALVLLVREPVRSHFGARVAYSLWLIPAARLLMPTLTETIERPSADRASPIPAIATPEPSVLFAQLGGWQTVLIGLWATGALTLFLIRMNEFRRQRSAILAAATEIGRAGSIRIVRSAMVRGPVAFGIVDRVIAVPADFEARYSEHERALALEHELAHHRSGDLIANFLAFVLLCLQWFNPLAWLGHTAFRFDQEAACDARVLDKADRCNRADYGRAIAKTASGRALLLASALDRRSTLRKRLKCMLHNPTAGQRMAGRLMVLIAVAAALPLTATRAIEYIDEPLPSTQDIPADPLSPDATLAAITAEPPRRPEQDNIAANGKPEFVQARVGSGEIQPEIGEAIQAGSEQARSDLEQAQRDKEQARRDTDQALRDLEQIRREADQAQREQEQARRDNTGQALRDLERVRREADQSLRDREQARRDADEIQRGREEARRDVAEVQREREQTRREVQQAQEQARREAAQAKRDQEQARRENEQARRDQGRDRGRVPQAQANTNEANIQE